MKPFISIIIPTYNRHEYLKECIDSALKQTYTRKEIIVADDSSKDETRDVCKSYGSLIKYFCNKKNLGMHANWRKALYDYAKGGYALILNDDDFLIDKNFVFDAAKQIEENDSISIVHAGCKVYYENKKKGFNLLFNLPKVTAGKNYFLNSHKMKYNFLTGSTIFKRNLALKLKAFKNPSIFQLDVELFLKMSLHGDVAYIKKEVFVYRKHKNSYGANAKIQELIKNFEVIDSLYKEGKKKLQINKLNNWRRRYTQACCATLMIWALCHKSYDDGILLLKNLKKTKHIPRTLYFQPKFILLYTLICCRPLNQTIKYIFEKFREV